MGCVGCAGAVGGGVGGKPGRLVDGVVSGGGGVLVVEPRGALGAGGEEVREFHLQDLSRLVKTNNEDHVKLIW